MERNPGAESRSDCIEGPTKQSLGHRDKENFQAVAVDVRNKIRKLERELGDLGPARVTSNDQRNHLIRIASEFREITVKAIDAYYGRDRCFEDDDAFRLATNVMEMNKSFSETIRVKGFTRTFRRSGGEESGPEVPSSSEDTPSTPVSPSGSENSELPQYPELRAIVSKLETEPPHAKSGIMRWITEKYDRSKGFEIGTLNPSLLPSRIIHFKLKEKQNI